MTVREYMLSPGRPALKLHFWEIKDGKEEQQWIPSVPGIYAEWWTQFDGEAGVMEFRRNVIVWGDRENKLLAHPFPVPEGDTAQEVKSIREMAPDRLWRAVRLLQEDDILPVGYGGTVAGYIRRVEAGENI